MAVNMHVCIGIDVGGTNTDAVVLHDRKVIAKSKHPTTSLITLGVQNALHSVLEQLSQNFKGKSVRVCRVNIGTTHFLNAVLQRKDLVAVTVVRLCGSASRALPPFCHFPEALRRVISGGYYFIDGGYEFDGKEIETVKRDEVLRVIRQIRQNGMWLKHRIRIYTEGPLASEPLKFVSPRISHYACCPPLLQQDKCMLISRTANKHAVLAGCSAFWQDTA